MTEAIKKLRKQLGLTQGQFSLRLGVSRVTVSRWESGKVKPCALARTLIEALTRTGGLESDIPPAVAERSWTAIRGNSRPASPARGATYDRKMRILRSCNVLSGLTDQQLLEISELASEVQVRSGKFVYCEGDATNRFYIIGEGRVKIVKQSPVGKDLIVAFRHEGNLFGSLTLVAGKPHGVSAKAVTEVKLLAIKVDEFMAFLSHRADVGFQVLRQILLTVGRLREDAVRSLNEMAVERADHRLAFMLYQLAGEFGPTLPVSREELAQMSGTTAETAIRITSRLRKSGTILPMRKKIVILDQGKLDSLIRQAQVVEKQLPQQSRQNLRFV